ncbi:hypothetical protein Hanom_Chr09g00848461 [Helianthus anomalus]
MQKTTPILQNVLITGVKSLIGTECCNRKFGIRFFTVKHLRIFIMEKSNSRNSK